MIRRALTVVLLLAAFTGCGTRSFIVDLTHPAALDLTETRHIVLVTHTTVPAAACTAFGGMLETQLLQEL